MSRWLRRLAVVAGAILVVVLAAMLLIRIWGGRRLDQAVVAFERDIGPLDLTRFQLPELTDEDNAATWLIAGGQATVIPKQLDASLTSALSDPAAEWAPQVMRDAMELIETNRPAIELLTRSLPLEGSTFGIDYERGFDAEMPPVIELWRAGRLVRIDSRLALAEGDRQRLERDIALLDRTSEALHRESLLITALIALSLDRLLIETVHEILQRPDIDADLIADLRRRIEGRDLMGVMRRALENGAVVAALTPVEQFETEPMSMSSRLAGNRLAPFAVAALLEGYIEMWSLLARPFVEIREFYHSRFGLPAWNVYGILLPNLLDAIGKAKAIETSQILALEALYARLACLDHGAYPSFDSEETVEPYSGGAITVQTSAGGDLKLIAPRAVELWAEEYSEAEHVQAPPLEWTLPSCN